MLREMKHLQKRVKTTLDNVENVSRKTNVGSEPWKSTVDEKHYLYHYNLGSEKLILHL